MKLAPWKDVKRELSDAQFETKEEDDVEDVKPLAPVSSGPCWELKDIWEWYDKLPWLAGMNYLPRTAVNFVEMWDESSFDIDIIQEELKWAAEKLGYNTLRTNIPMVLYEHDKQGLTERINLFLKVASRNGFIVMLCPLDDCEFSGEPAHPGPQPEPVPGLHNSRAIGSPGRHIVLDQSQWDRIKDYIKYVVRTWGHDKRILLIDLYNEPGNPWVFKKEGTFVIDQLTEFEKNALILMKKVFEWAREEKPTHPLTISAWHMPDPFFEGANELIPLAHEIDQCAMELSDVISIHAYCDPVLLQNTLMETARYGKPILLTEWMARQVQSTYDTALPTLKDLKVGAYQWGLVAGKSQTNLPWPHVAHKYEGDPTWWHDVLDAEGNFHNEAEGEVIRTFLYPQNRALPMEVLSGATLSEHSLPSMVDAQSHHHHPKIGSPVHSATSMHHLQSGPHLSTLTLDENNVAVILEPGEEAVIPSVCSMSMAQVNAAAAKAAAENTGMDRGVVSETALHHGVAASETTLATDPGGTMHHHHPPHYSHHHLPPLHPPHSHQQGLHHHPGTAPHLSASTPTLGSHMRSNSLSVEALDLDVSCAIEF